MSGDVVVGWSSTMTAIALFSGVQLLVLGIIGEYLGRLVQESRGAAVPDRFYPRAA